MALKLFRSTGYSTLLFPGEARKGHHPGWLAFLVAAWLGLACNVDLWRAATWGDPRLLVAALASSLLVAAACGLVLSALAWRRTLKPVATLLLAAGALIACGLWVQSLPFDSLWSARARGLLPAWPNWLNWRVPLLWALLGLGPALWVWQTPVRRLAGQEQLAANLRGMAVAALVLVAGGVLFWWH
jgi:glucan phosphoethanolaminetransferase (alkaline phosphatase superfamily)